MDQTSKINSLIADAVQAMDLIEASKKVCVAEHGERTKKLRRFVTALQEARKDGAMFDLEASISPEVQQLLTDPTGSL